ncbi:hypothetical protein DA803_00325 [[Mycoplasma] phocae]|uniref:Lipoprotein-associated type-17 domain-containing protein n=1 Tax=[Mycoplasma] phocae TaxID=142651 RepID=A0A2Z5ISA8_9BACT|nr:variable surface lipoprotein [[Mycoplasma] phocae]AXE60548.1 hypothetical protein DA803_00325 [[Mycoplasma] phocae]
MKKSTKLMISLGSISSVVVLPLVAAACGNSTDRANRKTNQSIDFTKYGVESATLKKERVLIHPAARDANKLDDNGVFTFSLHLEPTRGVTGEWLGFASEVRSLNDNTLVEPETVKVATTQADTTADPEKGFPLVFKWDGNNKLTEGKYYTFVFWKKDGTEKIVFKQEFINSSQDTFRAEKRRKTNQTLDFTKYGITKAATVKDRVLIHPAARDANKLDQDGVFKFSLHLAPTKGVTGTWIGVASEVKSLEDNTLVEPESVKVAETEADTAADSETGFPLIFKWDKENNKLTEGKAYTFVFWKKDGTERIVFKQEFIDSSRDTFLAEKARRTNQTIDFTKYGVAKDFPEGRVLTRTLIHPADRRSNKFNAQGNFRFALHLKPVEGATGEWIALATEVNSLSDNTLKLDSNGNPIVKKATTIAKPTESFPLEFIWSENGQKLEAGKFYTFIFWKKDGSEKIVFKDEFIKTSQDTFKAE